MWLAEKSTALATTSVALKLGARDDIDVAAIKREAKVWVRASGHANVLPFIDAAVYGDDAVIAASTSARDLTHNGLSGTAGERQVLAKPSPSSTASSQDSTTFIHAVSSTET